MDFKVELIRNINTTNMNGLKAKRLVQQHIKFDRCLFVEYALTIYMIYYLLIVNTFIICYGCDALNTPDVGTVQKT